MPVITSFNNSHARTKPLIDYPIKGSSLLSRSYYSVRMNSNGSQTTFTTSFWIKRTLVSLGSVQELWNAYDGTNYFELYFDTDDTLKISLRQSTSRYVTTRVFRDTTAWMHIVVAVDTTQATGSNRLKLYINGQDTTLNLVAGAVTVPQNTAMPINTGGVPHCIGTWFSGPTAYFTHVNIAEFYHIDGRQLTANDFGTVNSLTGQWVPKKFVGTTQWTRYTGLTTSMLSQSGLSAFSAANVIDNNITTSGFHTDSAGNNSFLAFDLGAGNAQDFRRIRFQLYAPSVGPIATWRIQYSDNGSTWSGVPAGAAAQVVNVHRDFSLTNNSPQYYYEIFASWASVGARRYWRILKNDAASGGDYHQGIDWYTLSGTDFFGSCGFYLPFDRQFDQYNVLPTVPHLGDPIFIMSGKGGNATVMDDRSLTLTTIGSPVYNATGGPRGNGPFISSFALPTAGASTTGARGYQTGDTTVLGSITTPKTWMCWLRSTDTGGRPGQWTTKVVAFGDFRNSVYCAFGLNNGRVAFGMNSVYEGTTNLADGNWHHIAMVYDGNGVGTSGAGTWSLYADGRLERVFRSSQETNATAWGNGRLDCVGFHWPYTITVPTSMTGMAVYNRALSDTEILGVYNGFDVVGGIDRSGNANHFFATGSTPALEDSPTNFFNRDTGAGGEVFGNYPKFQQFMAFDGSQSFGGLTTTTNDIAVDIGAYSGKWYWEYQMPISDDTYGLGAAGASGNVQHFGVVFANSNNASSSGRLYGGGPIEGKLVVRADQNDQKTNGTAISGAALVGTINHYFPGDYVGFALDLDSNPITLTYYRNGVVNGQHTATYNRKHPALPFVRTNGYTGTINFGQWPFRYPAPAGFKTLNTQNLIKPGFLPNRHMDVVTYTGNGTNTANALTVTGLNFQSDFIWIKNRSSAVDHWIQDTATGLTNGWSSNLQTGNITTSGDISSVSSTGFSISLNNSRTNAAGANYVAHCFRAGNSTTTNTNGTITTTVSANTLAGFSIVRWVGTGTASPTIGHGLGKIPAFSLLRDRTSTTQDTWVYLGTNNYARARLNLNGAGFIDGSNGLLHTSSTLMTLVAPDWNLTGRDYVIYTWAEIPGYSKFDTYTGNGSTSGPYVYCGFRPKFIMIKNLSNLGSWMMMDTTRMPHNPIMSFGNHLRAESNVAESSGPGDPVLITANGFRPEGTGSAANTSGEIYMFIAFADNPYTTLRSK